MDQIVYFRERKDKACVVRFVADYRKGSWLRKERIAYTFFPGEAMLMNDRNTNLAMFRVFKDYPDAAFVRTKNGRFPDNWWEGNRYWVAVRDDGRYFSHTERKSPIWTDDINDAEICLDRDSAERTTAELLRMSGEKIAVKEIYLTQENQLLKPSFIITCTSIKSQYTKYLSRIEGARLRLVKTSDAAARFTFSEAVSTFDILKASNKAFRYCVLPVFEDNVNCKDIEDYCKANKIPVAVQVTMKLKWLR